jgi:uncharacterized protein YjbI with pentapeptide repeats
MNNRDGFDFANTLTQIVVAVATVIALYKINEQTILSSEQLKLQRETSDRSWTAELLARVYDEDIHLHVREETVRAYVLLQRDLKREVRLPQANLEEMNLDNDDQYLKKADFESGSMRGINLESGKLQGAKLKVADLRHANFRNADLTDADLSNANLYGADLSNSTLVNVDFKGTNFTERNEGTGEFTGVVFAEGANFSGAKFDDFTRFCHIDLKGAKLKYAKDLKQHHLRCAVIDESTTLPEGLHAPRAGDCACLDNPLRVDR